MNLQDALGRIGLEDTQQPGLKTHKSASEAFSQDVAPRASGGGANLADALSRIGLGPDAAPAYQPVARGPAAAPSSVGDFSRGWSVAGKQLKQTAYGAAGLLGDTFGIDSLKDWGLRGYQDASKEIERISRPSDSFTTALSKDGSLVDWFQYSSGYLLGQAAETLAAAGAGALVGGAMSGPAAPVGVAGGAVTGALSQAAVQTGLRQAVSKLIDKEAGKLTAEFIARGVAADVARREAAELAVKSVYRSLGSTAAVTFLNATQSLGSIYGEAVEEAAKTGQEYSLGKVWLAGLASTAVDTWADSKALKGLSDAFKGRNRVSSIATEAFKGGLREGLTEGVQTTVERWGADKDLASKEAFREYIDSAAVGVLGGGITGGVKGAVSKLQASGEGSGQGEANFTRLPASSSARERPLAEDETPKMSDQEYASTIKDGGFMAALYERADEAGRRSILDAVRLEGVEPDFRKAMAPGGQAVIEAGRRKIDGTPDFVDSFMREIDSRLKAGVAGMDVAEFANSNPELLAYLYVNAGTAERRQIVREVAERSNALGAFTQALSSPSALELGEQWAVTQPDVLWARLEAFAKTQPRPGTAKFDRRGLQTAKSTTDVEDFEAGLAAEGGFTLRERPASPGEAMALPQETEGAAAVEPKDLSEVKLTDANRPLLAAYFADEIAALQKKKDGKGKTERLAQLERQALGVGFSQADVDQMFGRSAAQDAVTTGQVTQAIQQGKELGRGGNAIVFDLPGTKYVVRVPKGSAAPSPNAQMLAASDPFEGRNFGQPVFTVGNIQVLRRQDGLPAGLTNHRGLSQEQADERYELATISAATMPQEAYDQFAADLKYLNEKGASFDPSKSNNVLIDAQSGKFNLVDINQQKSADYNNSFGDMVVTLMGNTYAWRYKGSEDLTAYRRRIYEKALAAAKKVGLEISESDSSTAYSKKLAGLEAAPETQAKPPTASKGGSQAETKPGAGAGKKNVPDGLSEQPKKELGDSLAHLADVLAEITGARKNITGQKYTAADLPDALTRVMKALISEGVTQFKAAADRLMARMRANKDWAPLADKVDQGMLLKAWNAAGGGKVTQGIQKAPEGPAATLRSQTRAPKSIKGEDGMSRDMVINNQNPVSARQFYMSPEEVAENERAAEERRSGEDGGARGTKVSDGDDLEGATMVASREGGKRNPAASYYRQALRDAKALLSGRLAMVSPESGKKPQPMRLNSFILDRMGFEVFEVKLLDDSSGDGARRLAAIRDELSRNVAAVKERSKAKPAAAPPAPEGVANNDKPRGQIPLGISTPRVAAEPEGIRALKSAIDDFIRQTTNASFYEDSIRRLQAKISEIETLLKGVGELTADDGTTFRSRRRDEDERPGLWGYQDENAYDRFEGGMVYDKATPKSALLAARRKLTEDLQLAREGSQRGQARLYRIGMDRIENYILKLANDAISKSKAKPDQVREAVRPYLDGLNALRRMGEVRTEEAPAVDAALEEANRNLAQSDFLEGARVAMGLLSDFRSKRISQLELEALEMRGLREGDFTLFDLFNAYEAFGVSPQQRLFAAIKHFSARVSLKDYVAQHGGAASAVDAYFLDMENAQDLMGQQEFERRYAQRERDLLKRWQRERSNVLSRRRITDAMRNSRDPRKAFDGFLFTRITLEEARNPDLIRNTSLRQTYKGLFENLEEAWFSDLATALRRRPDLESALFNPPPRFFYQQNLGERIQAIQEGQLSSALPTAAVAADPVISPQERAAFKQWVDRLKAGVQKQAEVMARVPYFAALRNDPLLDAVTTPDGLPMVASTPKVDVDKTGLDVGLEAKGGREVRLAEYEQLYVKIVSGELEAVQDALAESARLRAVRARSVDEETGEIQLDADALDSILMNAQMESPLDQYGNVMTQFGARVQGDDKVVRTVEEAAQRDAQVGPSADASLEDLSTEEQIQEGLISEFESETQERADADSEAEDGRGADEGPAVEREVEERKGGRVPRSLVPGMEYRFRRGPAWDAFTMAAVQDIAERLTSGWKNATNVIVLPNAQHLPEPLRSRVIEKLAGSGAKGLYHEGSVYLFSQHLLDAADVEFTLFHESYGHLGMRAVLGEKFDQFLEIAYRTRPEVKEAADALIAGGMPKLEAIDEVLSDMAAANKEVSVVKQWAGRIVSGLREIGLSRVADWFASMTDAEVAYTLASARDAVRNGALPPINGAPSEIRLKGARPPYEVFAVKDGLTRGYARYNPVTDTWAVFSATGDDIRAGYTTMVTGDFDQVVEAMKHRGKVEYRLRSGLYVDDKIVADLVKVPSLNDREKYPLWDKRRWSQIRRDAQIRFQNEYLAVFEHVDFLERSGRLTPGTDVKTALTLYERRAGYEVERFRKAYVEPIQKLVEQAGKLGVTRKDIDRFLTARHAFERNAVIAAINPEMKDGGSGLTNDQAQAILDQVSASPAARVLDEIGRLTDRMGAEKVAYLSRTGMITKSMAKKLGGYRHYVNLSGESGAKVDMDDPGMLAGGSKFNVKGKERRALGRGAGNEAENVLERTLQAYEAALIRGQKNEVAQKVLALIETNYSPEFAIVNSQPRVRQFNPETGEVEEVIDANYLARKDVMVAKVGGIPVAIEFKESGFGTFADAIHGMVLPKDNTGFLAAMGRINRFLGSLLTTYNPAFVGINFLRDVGTVYFNAASDGRITQKMARDMMRALPKAISAAIHAASDGRLAKGADPNMLGVLRQMQATGGITYFADRKNLEEQVAQVESLLKGGQGPVQQKFQKVLGALEFLADVSEIAPRLAAYKVVKENGFSDDQAAVFSGEITVNFNMRGSAQWARQLFLFFNPAVQGSYKLWSLAKQNPGKFAAVAGGLFVLGFLTSMFARASAGEDEDGINQLDKVPVYKRATSIVLAPDAPLGAPIPIPYGWNAFFAAGTFVADSVLGAQAWATTGSRIVKTTAEAFSPIGMGASDAKSMESFLAKFFSPTAALPAVEIMLNENRFGAPIYKQQSAFDPAALPDAQSYFRGVSPISRAITDTLTEMTGGSKLRAGAVDVSPATIDHLFASFLPGLPSDVYKGAGVAIRASQGEDIKRVPWPVIDRFSARIPSGYDAGAYRRAAELVETLHREYANTRDQERRREIRAELPRLGYAHATITSTRQQLREIRSQMAALDSRAMSDDQRVARRNQLMKREEEVLRRATKRLMQAGEPVREAIVANE